MKSQAIEGPQAKERFERNMKALFQVPKQEVVKAEKKYKEKRKRKKA